MSELTFSDKGMMIGPQSNKTGVLHHTEPLEIILAPEFPPDYLPTTVALLLHDRSAALKALFGFPDTNISPLFRRMSGPSDEKKRVPFCE